MQMRVRSTAPAIVLTVVIAAADLVLGSSVSLVPLLVLGPLLAAASTGPRASAAVGALAFALAVGLGAANGMFLTSRHLVGLSTVAVGALLGAVVAAARARERDARLATERARSRSDLLARAGELFETGADPLQRLKDVTALPVPAIADVCIIDLVGPGGALRTAAATSLSPAFDDDLRRLRLAHPVAPDSAHPVARVARSGEPLLLRDVSPAERRSWRPEPERDLDEQLPYHSVVVVPLTARGRIVGTLALVRTLSPEPYDEADLGVARDLARRAGLAIDHARLGAELGETESELRTVLSALAEAVTVQDADGQLIYANEAAARINQVPDVETMLRTPLEDFFARWDVRDEHGAPIAPEQLPGRRALAGEAEPEPLLLQVVDRQTGERRWRLTKASPVPGPDGAARMVVNVIEDVTDQRQRELAQAFLARASKLLNASLDVGETLDKVAWAAVPDLADWCAVDMPDERGRLRRVATADRSPERTRMPGLMVGDSGNGRTMPIGPAHVLRSGVAEYYPEITDDLLRRAARDMHQLEQLRAVGARSVIVVPMVGPAGVTGTIMLGTVESGRRLTPDDLALAEELGRRAGIAVEHARVHGERSTIAATLQEALLPPRLPVIPGLTIAARFRAAGEAARVGGDFYDLFPLEGDPRAWMVVMGDVTGKGPAAAAITSLARYTMRTAALYEREPSRVLQRLNHVLVNDDDRRRLCTAICARVETAGGRARVTVACAGHPPPLRSGHDGLVTAIGEPGTLLGAFEDGHWTDATIELAERETLVLYTDGVTDTRGADGRFGAERLEAVLGEAAGRPPHHVASALDRALLHFQAGDQRDDVALLVLQPGADRGTASLVGVGERGEPGAEPPSA